MNVKELKSKGTDKCVLIDVRTTEEFNENHVEGATSIPLEDFTEEKFKSVCESDKPVVIICKSGSCAKKATAKLSEGLQKEVSVLEGGMEAWSSDEGEGGTCSLSMDNQILVSAGVLLFLFYILGYVHYIFGYLVLVVAAGLIYAGLVSTCGMKMILAKMPWNQCSKAKPNQCAEDDGCDDGG